MKCWNCGMEIETSDAAVLIDEFRNDLVKNGKGSEEWDQGFIDGLRVASDIVRRTR